MSKVENLAVQIISLGEHEQQKLLEKVAELNFNRGFNALSERYRVRLKQQGELDQSVDEILDHLKQTREDIASYEYKG